MRDGVALSVDIYRPLLRIPVPVVLIFTPIAGAIANVSSKRAGLRSMAMPRLWRTCGGASFRWEVGSFNPQHKTDGYDLVEWISKQGWSNAKVGMTGLLSRLDPVVDGFRRLRRR